MSFEIIDLEQGSQQWLSFRKNHITATDTGIIMGLNPWKTPLMLWEEKLGLREPQAVNDKMREGSLMENDALFFWNKKLESDYKPTVLVPTTHPFMMASLDGMNSEGKILEIKCGKASHEMAKDHEIAPYYYSQMQKQMYVSNAKFTWFLSYRSDDDNIHFTVNRDNELIEKMIVAETAFYKCLMDFTPPPATDRDFIKKDDYEWVDTVKNWKDCKRRIQCEEDLEKVLRDDLIKLCEGQSCQGAGVRISKTVTKGRVDYSKIECLKDVDLDSYRGKAVESYRFTEVKQ